MATTGPPRSTPRSKSRFTPRRRAVIADPLAEARTRRQRRAAARLWSILLLVVVGAISLVLMAMIKFVHDDYNWIQSQVNAKEAQLAALQSQYDVGQRRLAALKSDKGREEILVEHGYIRPGDRILLFPATRDEQQAAQIPKNDVAPHPPLTQSTPPGAVEPSVWKRAGNVLRGWWQSLRAGAGVKPANEKANVSSHATPKPPEPAWPQPEASGAATSSSGLTKPAKPEPDAVDSRLSGVQRPGRIHAKPSPSSVDNSQSGLQHADHQDATHSPSQP